jgi:hypothetical protein
MSLTATVEARIFADRIGTSGLTQYVESAPVNFGVSVGDCTKVWRETRVFGSQGFDEVDFSLIGIDVVKVICINNLSDTTQIALSAGWNGSQFANFRQDVTSWNFSPMINLGSLTLRGYPIREKGSFLLSCPNSDGFGTTAGGSILRVGGTPGQQYEIYVMGN